MAKNYKHLTAQERAVVMTMRNDQGSIRFIAKGLCRSASTIAREVQHTAAAAFTTLSSPTRSAMPDT